MFHSFQQVQKMVTNQTMISNELMWHRIGWFQDLIMHLEAWLDFPLSDEEGNFAGNVGRVGVLFKSNLRGQPAKSYKKIKTRMENRFGDQYKPQQVYYMLPCY
ncbi:uncharacterized protein LOC110224381 isoform X2 [Arabidopsis lyrata subsp. lyrata]|uniref:uncharacterized protein LOC110224381 isoform X2 n=1 Tax=Arabidopsis lyrata subsp. lyrata TaxID=81972 RepID=UPI000A29C66E|nr:uncharacterized protein LOC110224381 isoform X2 [Arabidopsis lyrata subsp. lyrata]|eukprot:XP_020866063.1 uncharacterized protein LOC110224381 isoform X2 [Arabidopsis lyrata subsp. lyrata]